MFHGGEIPSAMFRHVVDFLSEKHFVTFQRSRLRLVKKLTDHITDVISVH